MLNEETQTKILHLRCTKQRKKVYNRYFHNAKSSRQPFHAKAWRRRTPVTEWDLRSDMYRLGAGFRLQCVQLTSQKALTLRPMVATYSELVTKSTTFQRSLAYSWVAYLYFRANFGNKCIMKDAYFDTFVFLLSNQNKGQKNGPWKSFMESMGIITMCSADNCQFYKNRGKFTL